MGLDTTHGAFNGGYGTFDYFRRIVATAAGVSYPPHNKPLVCSDGDIIVEPSNSKIYVPGTKESFTEANPGLSAFLFSSDCEGSFLPKTCKQMANEIEELLPKIKKLLSDSNNLVQNPEYYIEITEQYIAGCRLAHSEKKKLRYH